MANFIALVYATLKEEGIDTKGMSTDEAVEKFKEIQGKENPEDVKKKLNGEKPQVKPKRVVDEGAKKIHQEREKAKKENINNALEYAKAHNEMSYSIKQKGGEPDIEATINFATGDIKTKGSNVVRNIYDGGYTNKEKWIKDHFVDTDWKIKESPEDVKKELNGENQKNKKL